MANSKDRGKKRSDRIEDFISREWVRATPEERETVQPLLRRLVVDYGYPPENFQTHPQHRVRKSPSDEGGSFPVDIAIFSGSTKLEQDLYIVVECKAKDRVKGEVQLRLYMDMSAAEIAMWSNGDEHIYLRKVYHPNGTRTYERLPDIPRYGQRVEDIGLFRKEDLIPPSDLRSIFRDIRHHLAGNLVGTTRDEALARQIINLLFCKIYDEIKTPPGAVVQFRAGVGESAQEVADRILAIFDRMKHDAIDGYVDVFDDTDMLILDPESVVYVVGELHNYSLLKANRDAIGDAFEIFIGPALRGSEGQFFTPRNVVRMIVDGLDPAPGEMLIDPACGSGGFLIVALEHVWSRLEEQAAKEGWTDEDLNRRKRRGAEAFFRGIEKDDFLAKVTKAYMAIVGDGRAGIFGNSSLRPPSEWTSAHRDAIGLNKFEVVMTNPPFGSKIKITGDALLSQFELGHKWKRNALDSWEPTGELLDDQVPQLLFIERILQLLRPGGRLGIVLPESIFGMPKYDYVVQYLREHTKIVGIVSMPEALFKTSGKGGTHTKTVVLFARKKKKNEKLGDYDIFMADAKWCGHDSRSNPTIRRHADGSEELLDDIPLISQRFQELASWE